MSKRNEVRDELHRLAKANGGILHAEHVVKAAEDKKSPLHECFQWDDAEAGYSFRLMQAEKLIRTIRIEYASTTKKEHRIRVHHYAPNPLLESGYSPVEVMLRTTTRRPFLLQEIDRLVGHVNRVAALLLAAGRDALAADLQSHIADLRRAIEEDEAPAMAGN